jgi:hypothetical protein
MPGGRPVEVRSRPRMSNGDIQASIYDNEEDRFRDVSTSIVDNFVGKKKCVLIKVMQLYFRF